MWLDGGPKVSQMADKLAPRWFGPFTVLEVLAGGSAVRLDFSAAPDMDRFTDVVNLRRLKFFEARDAAFCDGDEEVAPSVDADGGRRYEVERIQGHRTHKQQRELFVKWRGFDTTWCTWVRESSLRTEVPQLVDLYWAQPSSFTARPSAPKRASRVAGPGSARVPLQRSGRRAVWGYVGGAIALVKV